MDKNDREAKLIRERRKSLGLTQIQTAVQIGIELQQYQRYEYGAAQNKKSNASEPLRLGGVVLVLL